MKILMIQFLFLVLLLFTMSCKEPEVRGQKSYDCRAIEGQPIENHMCVCERYFLVENVGIGFAFATECKKLPYFSSPMIRFRPDDGLLWLEEEFRRFKHYNLEDTNEK